MLQLKGCGVGKHYLSILAVLALVSVPAVASEAVTLLLPTGYDIRSVGFYAALEQGFYEDEGVDVRLLDSDEVVSESSTKAVQEAEADFAVSDAWGVSVGMEA